MNEKDLEGFIRSKTKEIILNNSIARPEWQDQESQSACNGIGGLGGCRIPLRMISYEEMLQQ